MHSLMYPHDMILWACCSLKREEDPQVKEPCSSSLLRGHDKGGRWGSSTVKSQVSLLISGGGGFHVVFTSCAHSHVNLKALAPNWRMLFQLQPRTSELLTSGLWEPNLFAGRLPKHCKGWRCCFSSHVLRTSGKRVCTACCKDGHPTPEWRVERNWFAGVC